MRRREEMLTLILDTGKSYPLIRAVFMNGSQTNSKIPVDRWQDFDIVYLVEKEDWFHENREWIDVFGERLIMQTPMDMDPDGQQWFTYLMQFKDGNRIDLMIVPIEDLNEYLASDSLIEVLLDKDDLAPKNLASNDSMYWVKNPSEHEYLDTINEFLWVSLYVLKGIKRNNILYAIDHVNIMRTCYLTMCDTLFGLATDFKKNVGKSHHKLQEFLGEESWSRLLMTYRLSSVEDIDHALSLLFTDFEDVSMRVAKEMNYSFNRIEYHEIIEYIAQHRNV